MNTKSNIINIDSFTRSQCNSNKIYNNDYCSINPYSDFEYRRSMNNTYSSDFRDTCCVMNDDNDDIDNDIINCRNIYDNTNDIYMAACTIWN